MPIFVEVFIASLLAERKPLPLGWRSQFRPKRKAGHDEADLVVRGSAGSDFLLLYRQNALNPIDFSVILGFRPLNSSRILRLRRYNGKSHQHSNRIERDRFYDFHIHEATERYQVHGFDEDGFAQPTSRYSSIEEALECLIKDCGFEEPPLPLFPEGL